MINLDLIWDNVFKYLKDRYGLFKVGTKEELQIYGDNTPDNDPERIKWIFYQEAKSINANNAAEVLSGVLKTGHSSSYLIAELIDKLLWSGLTLEQKYLYNLFEIAAKVRSYRRSNMFATSVKLTDLDNVAKDNPSEIDLIVRKINEEVLLRLNDLCCTQKDIFDELEICINQVGAEKSTHLLTIIIAYALLKVDYTAFRRDKKTIETNLGELQKELKEYILKEFEQKAEDNSANMKAQSSDINEEQGSSENLTCDTSSYIDVLFAKFIHSLNSVYEIKDVAEIEKCQRIIIRGAENFFHATHVSGYDKMNELRNAFQQVRIKIEQINGQYSEAISTMIEICSITLEIKLLDAEIKRILDAMKRADEDLYKLERVKNMLENDRLEMIELKNDLTRDLSTLINSESLGRHLVFKDKGDGN